MILTFIGMPECDRAQSEYLTLLGAALATDGVGLIAKDAGKSNHAIIKGHIVRGGRPETNLDPLTTPSQGLLVFGDPSFVDLLDDRAPGWRDLDPTIVHPDELHDYVMSALAGLKSKELAVSYLEVTE